MSLNEVKTIEKYGHTIGMHGFNHENFGKLSPNEISKIITEGLRIFEKYNIKTEHFAYPFGDKKSFNLTSNKILFKYFRFLYSGVRGFNLSNINSSSVLLKRHPVSTQGRTCFITQLV